MNNIKLKCAKYEEIAVELVNDMAIFMHKICTILHKNGILIIVENCVKTHKNK